MFLSARLPSLAICLYRTSHPWRGGLLSRELHLRLLVWKSASSQNIQNQGFLCLSLFSCAGGNSWCFFRQILELQSFPLACNPQKTPKWPWAFSCPKGHPILFRSTSRLTVSKKSNTEVLGAERNVASFSSWSLPKVNKRLCNTKDFGSTSIGLLRLNWTSTDQISQHVFCCRKGAGIMARILKATVQSSRVLASSQSPQANLWVKSWWVGELRLIKMDQRGC